MDLENVKPKMKVRIMESFGEENPVLKDAVGSPGIVASKEGVVEMGVSGEAIAIDTHGGGCRLYIKPKHLQPM